MNNKEVLREIYTLLPWEFTTIDGPTIYGEDDGTELTWVLEGIGKVCLVFDNNDFMYPPTIVSSFKSHQPAVQSHPYSISKLKELLGELYS